MNLLEVLHWEVIIRFSIRDLALKPFIHGLHNCLGKEAGGLTLPAGLWPAGNGGVSHILKGDGEAVFEEAVDVAVLQN